MAQWKSSIGRMDQAFTLAILLRSVSLAAGPGWDGPRPRHYMAWLPGEKMPGHEAEAIFTWAKTNV
jgi:hypothetical protein